VSAGTPQGKPLRQYRSVIADSARWEGFLFRDGDIVLSSPVKCGTTWVQMICAVLIFQRATLGTTLDIISPWLEMLTRPLGGVLRDLERQTHRRFIKSHTPLDGLPYDPRVTYVCIARDPRDVALSFCNHIENMDIGAFLAARQSAAGDDDLADLLTEVAPTGLESERQRFWWWIDAEASANGTAQGLSGMIHHLATFWEARAWRNVLLLHYQELQEDLEGQMRRLSNRLSLDIPERLWPPLVHAASFDEMRRRADELAPNVTELLWFDNARFFNRGTSGQWRDLLSKDDLRRYKERVMGLASPELERWIHRERL
jgi:hypothetical protein